MIIFLRRIMQSFGMCCRVALVITDVSEEHVASIIRAEAISELGIILAATRATLRHSNGVKIFKSSLDCPKISLYDFGHSDWDDGRGAVCLLTRLDGQCNSRLRTPCPLYIQQTNKQTPWPLVRERTIPSERPPLVDEI
jgi:hypothetical protein